jgi:DNA processing protein
VSKVQDLWLIANHFFNIYFLLKIFKVKKCIGIVGTRKVTQYGKLCTERFATSFTEAGAIVVSGLATGVDTYAHQATIKAKGITYAVIASGIDCLSPSYAQKIADDIMANDGAIISEYRCGVKAMPAYFPQRNRIISGISSAVVVVESALKGGSLITAQFAIDQYKELYAIPGNITSERSAGTNKLIQRNLAKPALSPDDVLLDLDIAPPSARSQLIDLNEHEAMVYTALSGEPKIADQLAEELSMNINDILVHLLMLEFKNVIVQLPGKQFIKRL